MALAVFERALAEFRAGLASDSILHGEAFAGTAEWIDLLTYKLVPHLAGEGCLVVTIAGGTNTGKSTVFNLLVGRNVSAVSPTAAATCHPVIAANAERAAQCLAGKLVPGFAPFSLERPESALERAAAANALFVAVVDDLPGDLVFLDTPDIDSIDSGHWTIAEHIRAAGDVILAVITAEKYRDDRVAAFFREAAASGREVIPVMNKANPEGDFAVARMQLDEFCADLGGTAAARFIVGHDFELARHPDRPIASLDGGPDLRAHLEGMEAAEIARQVYRGTLDRFVESAGAFLERTEQTASSLQAVNDEFSARAAHAAQAYDPVPGEKVGGLFHDFVQQKRGTVRRYIGSASKAVASGIGAVGRSLVRTFRRRTELAAQSPPKTDEELRRVHAMSISTIARDLARGYIETAGNLREPAAHLIQEGVERLDMEAAIEAVVKQTLRADALSEEFRRHAHRTLETWWHDHRGRRRVVEALDALLAMTPAAIAVPMAIYTGPGIPEATVAIAGPVVEQFAARVFEYQFADAMFDFLSPWRAEQQGTLEQALLNHIARPILEPLTGAIRSFEGGPIEAMKTSLQGCAEAETPALKGEESG